MSACGHACCAGILNVPATFHANLKGPDTYFKYLRARGMKSAVPGEVALFSAWWPPRGDALFPPSELVDGRRGLIEVMRPGACNMLTNKKRLVLFLEEFGLSSLAPPTIQSPADLLVSNEDVADSKLWFLKHTCVDDNAGVTVYVGRASCQEAWRALPDDVHSHHIAQPEVPQPLLDPSRRKLTFRVFLLVGLVPVSAGAGIAWCLYRKGLSCRSHPLPYNHHATDKSIHVTSSVKNPQVEYRPSSEVFSESEMAKIGIESMLTACMRPFLQGLLVTEALGPGGVGRLGFDLLGVDLIIDERLRPWILEFNQRPDMDRIFRNDRISAARETIINEMFQVMLDSVRATGCLHSPVHGVGGWMPLLQVTRDATAPNTCMQIPGARD